MSKKAKVFRAGQIVMKKDADLIFGELCPNRDADFDSRKEMRCQETKREVCLAYAQATMKFDDPNKQANPWAWPAFVEFLGLLHSAIKANKQPKFFTVGEIVSRTCEPTDLWQQYNSKDFGSFLDDTARVKELLNMDPSGNLPVDRTKFIEWLEKAKLREGLGSLCHSLLQ
eukprot:g13230.t1